MLSSGLQVTEIEIITSGPISTVQDDGRFGALRHGVAASGPMDRTAYARAGALLGGQAGTAIESGPGRFAFRVAGGAVMAAFCGGEFELRLDGILRDWPVVAELPAGAEVQISPGPSGNFGLVRFDQVIDVPKVLGSRSTSLIAGLGGLEGRCLRDGDVLSLAPCVEGESKHQAAPIVMPSSGTIRVIWGIHADTFSSAVRTAFCGQDFAVSSKIDRMGMQLVDRAGVFAGQRHLSLVSDVVVPGDIQILGDGTPVVLMRDHQPTGGYPRIATVIGPDLDRLAQMRPGNTVRFTSVSVNSAHAIIKSTGWR